jgi:hypothetical protein
MTTPIPLQYIHTDIPQGMTIRDWRHARRPPQKRSRLGRVFGPRGLFGVLH